MKFSAGHLIALLGAATVGALAPEPTLLLAAHALLLVVGIQVVRVVERADSA